MEERWMPVPDCDEGYEASTLGRIRNADGRILKYGRLITGIRNVGMRRNGRPWTRQVHRVIAITFLGDIAPGLEVNHKDHDRNNNRLDNLEVCTRKQNIAHHWKRFWQKRMGITEVCSALESA